MESAPGTARERVVADVAADRVASVAAVGDVVPGQRIEHVVAVAAVELVGAGISREAVVSGAAVRDQAAGEVRLRRARGEAVVPVSAGRPRARTSAATRRSQLHGGALAPTTPMLRAPAVAPPTVAVIGREATTSRSALSPSATARPEATRPYGRTRRARSSPGAPGDRDRAGVRRRRTGARDGHEPEPDLAADDPHRRRPSRASPSPSRDESTRRRSVQDSAAAEPASASASIEATTRTTSKHQSRRWRASDDTGTPSANVDELRRILVLPESDFHPRKTRNWSRGSPVQAAGSSSSGRG